MLYVGFQNVNIFLRQDFYSIVFSQNEKICFIMDESNVLDSSFLERMNTLLANGEVPGLFEGDEYTTLMTQCKEGAIREGLMLDSAEELYKWFTSQVRDYLHVTVRLRRSLNQNHKIKNHFKVISILVQ